MNQTMLLCAQNWVQWKWIDCIRNWFRGMRINWKMAHNNWIDVHQDRYANDRFCDWLLQMCASLFLHHLCVCVCCVYDYMWPCTIYFKMWFAYYIQATAEISYFISLNHITYELLTQISSHYKTGRANVNGPDSRYCQGENYTHTQVHTRARTHTHIHAIQFPHFSESSCSRTRIIQSTHRCSVLWKLSLCATIAWLRLEPMQQNLFYIVARRSKRDWTNERKKKESMN